MKREAVPAVSSTPAMRPRTVTNMARVMVRSGEKVVSVVPRKSSRALVKAMSSSTQ